LKDEMLLPWIRVARIEIDFSARVSVRDGVASTLGLELSAMGVRRVLLVVGDTVQKSVLSEICEGLSAAQLEWGALFIHPEAYSVRVVDRAVEFSRKAQAVVALGCWLPAALSKILSARLGTVLVAIPVPPGLAEAFSRMTVQPRGYVGPSKPLRLPDAIFVDTRLISRSLHSEELQRVLAPETLLAALEALAVGWRNSFVRLLAETAVEKLEQSLRGSLADAAHHLFEAAVYAALARGHAMCSALSSLARALFALFGVDPYVAELAIARAWVTAASQAVEGSPAADAYRRATRLLEELTGSFSAASTLVELGVGENKLDLAVEYAWTFEHYCVELDPAVSSRFSLRQLLVGASFREAQRRC